MPWYKVYADLGGGHMSHSQFYHWEPKKLTKQEKEDLWENSFRDANNAVGDVQQVGFLPADVKEAKIKALSGRVEFRSIRLLQIVQNTQVRGCEHLYTREVAGLPPGSLLARQCKSCSKVRVYGWQTWKKMPKNFSTLVKWANWYKVKAVERKLDKK